MVMYRFMTLMWSRNDSDAAQEAKFVAAKLKETSPHKWSKFWDRTGLAVFHSGERKGRMQTYRLVGGRGVVLGRLFRNDYTSVTHDLDEFESRQCLQSNGQYLVDNFWGQYVAFLNNLETGARFIIRDPSGAFPCFHSVYRGVTIYFSDMQDAANFDFLPFTVNWESLKTNFVLPQFRTVHTGLNEVGEILPSECIEVTPFEKKSHYLWNPTEISKKDIIENPNEASAVLRETVMKTIGVLTGSYDRVLHNLGGLDSSIVLACLAQAPKRPEISCISFFTGSPRGEERYYSRQVAKKYDIELTEVELDYRKVELDKLYSAGKLAKARAVFDGIELTGDILALAEERCAEVLTFGTGGDNVLYQPPFNFSALDYARQNGLIGSDTLRVAIAASRYGRKSLFSTLRDMLRERVAPLPCYDYVRSAILANYRIPIINPDFIGHDNCEQYLSPLLVPRSRDLKGKYLHIISSLLGTNEYYHHYDINYSIDRIRAFFTQPIIEVCLRIPTWVMTHGGIDRGLARKAFADALPPDVIRRLSKSTPGEFYRDIFVHNRGFLEEVLLDGVLVNKGVFLKKPLEEAVRNENLFLHIGHGQLLGYAELELWTQGWVNRKSAISQPLEVAV